ncbi:hypothetical protein CCP4SC76_2460004 [Gammaproteobacteria bacterium]
MVLEARVVSVEVAVVASEPVSAELAVLAAAVVVVGQQPLVPQAVPAFVLWSGNRHALRTTQRTK